MCGTIDMEQSKVFPIKEVDVERLKKYECSCRLISKTVFQLSTEELSNSVKTSCIIPSYETGKFQKCTCSRTGSFKERY